MKDFSIYITMDCWKLERGGLFQDTEEEEESVITYPHLCILPITSADNPRSNSPQFTHLNIRISAAPHIHILPEALAHRWVVSLKPDCTARLCASILCSSFSSTAFFAPKYRPSWTHRSKIEFGNICSVVETVWIVVEPPWGNDHVKHTVEMFLKRSRDSIYEVESCGFDLVLFFAIRIRIRTSEKKLYSSFPCTTCQWPR